MPENEIPPRWASSHKDVYKIVGTGVLDCLQQSNFGGELVFSADLCYNGTNEKPRPQGVVAAKPTERAGLCAKNPLTRYRGSSPKGRAYSCARASSGVWALPCAYVIQGRNWR